MINILDILRTNELEAKEILHKVGTIHFAKWSEEEEKYVGCGDEEDAAVACPYIRYDNGEELTTCMVTTARLNDEGEIEVCATEQEEDKDDDFFRLNCCADDISAWQVYDAIGKYDVA